MTKPMNQEEVLRYAARLRFPGEMETRFCETFTRESLPVNRFAYALAPVLYAVNTVVVAGQLSPANATWGYLLGLGVVCPMFLACFLASGRQLSPLATQLLTCFAEFVAAGVVIIFFVITDQSEPPHDLYFAGLILTLIFVWAFLSPRFHFALPSTAGVVIAYGIAAWWSWRSNPGGNDPGTLLLGGALLLTTSIAGLAICYFLEVLRRREFGLRQLVAIERERADRLLRNILPQKIADRLKDEHRSLAEHHDEVTVLFADLVGFTSMSSQKAPAEVVSFLDELFSHFDLLAEKFGLEKIKTIGDCYMAAAGIPEARADHAEAAVGMALEMLRHTELSSHPPFRLRIGLNSGPVVAGVIGRKKFIYDLWGDCVNTASRMESHGISGGIQISAATYERVKGSFRCQSIGTIEVKGKGKMPVWRVLGRERDVMPPEREWVA